MSDKQTTMTIAHVSMAPRKEIADEIRRVCEKHKIPISGLMQSMLTPQMPKIEEFALAFIAERDERERLEKEKQEQIKQAGKVANLKAYQSRNLFTESTNLKNSLEHDRLVTEARFTNVFDDLDKLNSKIDRLLEIWEDKPVIGTANESKPLELEPIDSNAWGT